ncbi:MAG: hypothetical protein GXO82_01540 [Chlorobi bacterium]|nr:hypothetical protein [Chlorobiota bacterium]
MRKRFALSMLALMTALTPTLHGQYIVDYTIGDFTGATHFSIDPVGNVFVSDTDANLVLKLNLKGDVLAKFGGKGWQQNQLDHPLGIDARFGIEVYVADYGNNRIVQLDKNLNFIAVFERGMGANPEEQFGYPRSVSVNRLGDLYLLDYENLRVLKVSTFSSVVDAFGNVESGEGQITEPRDLAVDRNDIVYVLEPNRVVAFDPFGTFIWATREGQLDDATSIAANDDIMTVTTAGAIFLLDRKGNLERLLTKADIAGLERVPDFLQAIFFQNRLLILSSNYIIVLAS